MFKQNFLTAVAVLFLATCATAQTLVIPNANFKNALVNTDCVDTDADNVGDADADTNNNGEIELSEATAVLGLDVSSRQISSLSGIENFTNLLYLDCRINQLTTMSMQGLDRLKQFNCANNQFTTLNVQNCTRLEIFYCLNNTIASLNLQGLNSLQQVYAQNNQLTNLNIQGLPSLTSINCNQNRLASLNVQGITNLQYLYCTQNLLTGLNATGLNNLVSLFCNNNALTSLNIQNLGKLETVYCYLNQLTTVSTVGLRKLKYFYAYNNLLTVANMEECVALIDINLNNNKLQQIYIKNGSTEMIDFAQNPTLGYICCDLVQQNDIQTKVSSLGYVGCTVNSFCIVATENAAKNANSTLSILAYPNPTDGIVHFETDLNIDTIIVYDALGREMLREMQRDNGVQNQTVDLSNLGKGLYFIKIFSGSNSAVSKVNLCQL